MMNAPPYPDLTKGISVIIPVYNSASTLLELVDRLALTLKSLNLPYELILVNDGSKDESWKLILDLRKRYEWIQGLNMMRNYGQHNALLAGIRMSHYDLAATLDDDLQHPPEALPKLIHELLKGHDVVYAPAREEPHGLWRGILSRLFKITLRIALSKDIAGKVSAYRVFKTSLRTAFETYNGPFVSVDVLLTWATTKFSSVTISHAQRKAGVSNYNLKGLFRHALTLTTGFSILPLQFATIMGFSFTLFGMLVLIYVIGRYLIEGESVAGFPFLASTIAIFSGAQMLALGIIGEYLARIHFRMMGRPTYIISEQTRKHN